MRLRNAMLGGAMLVALSLGGCSERPTAVEPAQEPASGGPLFDHTSKVDTTVSVLERLEPLARDIEVRGKIGPDGGDIKIREAGLQVSFPAGAVSELTEFRLVARKGKALIYEFYPSPTEFAVPVKVEISLKETSAYKNDPLMQRLQGAYFPGDGAAEYEETGSVHVTELVPVDVEVKTSKIKFEVHHFSGYLVAVG